MNDINVADLRENYKKGGIPDENIPKEPIPFFEKWLKEAISSDVMEPNAMSLATVDSDGKPSVRLVLLKGIEGDAIHFYTNYESEKGRELAKHPHASVAFWWPELERQIRISGSVQKLSHEVSSDYFNSRPRESQLGAWASSQSQPVETREDLQKHFDQMVKKFEGKEIPKPDFWGGFQVRIEEIEFWQGRTGRLHDRIKYKKADNFWTKERLQP